MQFGLTIEPNDRDLGGIDVLLLEQAFDGLRVRLGDQLFGFGEDPGARPSVGEPSIGERPSQQGAFGSRIGATNARTRAAERDAVGLEERRIHPSKQVPLMRPMVLIGTMDVPVESG
jgi:hypothetical protein